MHVILLVQQESLAIDKLEQELNNCKVDYGDNASTADMNNATYDAIDCVVGVHIKYLIHIILQLQKKAKSSLINWLLQFMIIVIILFMRVILRKMYIQGQCILLLQ